ncbi:SusE domain-containing protein [Hymenobacter cheonanensis]|uniref:SusE domain-containing protein n=1 Tax=Hymenobacter sp. CA2-7 TaxID=3063993 RepID=UPI0027131F80|nr:SusE domain-containing protein [Hymenobacter sp. CA2-7]MDO7883911.1 SusE domain-containing protein [Hymenobacter sp. CA2-7]
MQSWITKFALGAVALASLSFSACKKDEVRATLTPSNSPTLTSTTNTVVLAQANATQTAATYTWTPVSSLVWANADNTYKPAITYYIQVDTKGHNFGAPVSLPAGNGPNTALTVSDLNTALTTLGVTPGTATDVEVRLNASYATNSTTVSNVLPLKVTTYKVCVPPAGSSTWSIIGPAGVDWSTDVPLTYNCDTKTFDITRTLNAGDFKFRANGAWDVNYGSNSATGGAIVANGSNITVATAGTYTIKLDLNNKVYSITK